MSNTDVDALADELVAAERAHHADELSTLDQLFSNISLWCKRVRRKLPYLVWYGDEVDVTITFTSEGLKLVSEAEAEAATTDNKKRKKKLYNEAEAQLRTNPVTEAENLLRRAGLKFDTGTGFGGRDWEFDWSLSGPVHVTFRSRAKAPSARL